MADPKLTDLEKLVNLLAAINSLTPIVGSLVASLRNPGETDDEVVARARAFVAETKQITELDMTDAVTVPNPGPDPE